MQTEDNILQDVTDSDYKYGFYSHIETDEISRGLSETTVRLISEKKNEPDWLLEFRLKAFQKWQTMTMPTWAHLDIPPIDYQNIIYYSAPKKEKKTQNTYEISPEITETSDQIGKELFISNYNLKNFDVKCEQLRLFE